MANRALNRREFLGMAAVGVAGLPVAGDLGTTERRSSRQATVEPPGDPVVVASVPLAAPSRGADAFRAQISAAREAGVDALCVPVAAIEHFEATAANLLAFHGLCRDHADAVVVVRTIDDIARARKTGRVGIVAQFQGMQMIVEELERIKRFKAAGVGVMALTHNWKNWNGDGCLERTDLPLTGLGALAVTELNAAGVLIDLSRVGHRGSLQAMDVSTKPVVFTHSNAKAVHDHSANLTDAQLDACAVNGGVVCVSAFPALVAPGPSSLGDVLDHVDYVARRIGSVHVGLGLDFDDLPRKRFADDPFPDPPYHYPRECSSLRDVNGLRQALRARGYSDAEVTGIMGGNFMRVLVSAWQAEGTV